MSDDQVSPQAEPTEETSSSEGYESVPVIPEEPPEVEEPLQEEPEEDNEEEATPKEKRLQDKKDKISQKKWKEMVDKSKDFDTFKEHLAKALGVKEEDVEETDLMEKMQSQVDTLKTELERKDWEVDHPEVRSESYKEQWTEVIKKKGHLVRSGDLSYDDLFKIIKDDSTKAKDELREQDLNLGSQPPTSKSSVSEDEGIKPEVKNWMKDYGYTEEQIKSTSKS